MLIETKQLSHSGRIALTIRCARRVKPLFEAAWPDANARRKESLDIAIALAEQSMREGSPCEGLKKAAIEALMTAGRANLSFDVAYPQEIRMAEPAPLDKESSVIACLSARVFQFAAETAMAKPSDSAKPCDDAFYFAIDAVRAAGGLELIELLEADYVVERNRTKMKPWWRFW